MRPDTYVDQWLRWKRPDCHVILAYEAAPFMALALFRSDRMKGRPYCVVVNDNSRVNPMMTTIRLYDYRTLEQAERGYADLKKNIIVNVARKALRR